MFLLTKYTCCYDTVKKGNMCCYYHSSDDWILVYDCSDKCERYAGNRKLKCLVALDLVYETTPETLLNNNIPVYLIISDIKWFLVADFIL